MGRRSAQLVASGGSYAGPESAVVGLQGTGGVNAGGDAKILAGTKSVAATSPGVSMSWRTPLVNTGSNGLLDETHSGPGSAFQSANSRTALITNVVNLSGLETGSPWANSTDPFVFDMSYNSFFIFNEQGLAQNKLIYMVSPSPGPDDGKSQYVNTVQLNSGNVVTNPSDPNFGALTSWNCRRAGQIRHIDPDHRSVVVGHGGLGSRYQCSRGLGHRGSQQHLRRDWPGRARLCSRTLDDHAGRSRINRPARFPSNGIGTIGVTM